MIIIVLIHMFRRERRIMNMSIILQIIRFISPQRISLLTHIHTLTPLLWNEVHLLQCHHSQLVLVEWWTLCHPSRCGWWRKRTNLLCRVRSPDDHKRLKNLLEIWNCLKGCKLIMHKWFIHFTRPHSSHIILTDEIHSDEIDVIFFTMKHVSSKMY